MLHKTIKQARKFGTYSDFTVNSRVARRIAAHLWGDNLIKAFPTSHSGTYYYSCEDGGGYVLDAYMLTPKEREDIIKYVKPKYLNVLVQDNIIRGFDYQQLGSRGRENYGINLHGSNAQWVEHEVFVFTEAREWAVLEFFTDIRRNGVGNKKEHTEVIERTFRTFKAILA